MATQSRRRRRSSKHAAPEAQLSVFNMYCIFKWMQRTEDVFAASDQHGRSMCRMILFVSHRQGMTIYQLILSVGHRQGMRFRASVQLGRSRVA